jgi:lipid II:glycine glycyltransferase (peptidoglycan interpeptide bridge formation enzyme)
MTNKTTYLQFCEKEKEVPTFSQPWLLDAVCGKDGWDVLIVKKGNEIAATMPIQVRKKYGLSLPRMPLFVKYWGPYFPKIFRSPKHQQRLMRELIHQFPKFDLFEQYFHPSIKSWLPFLWEKFEGTIRYTFKINLEEDLEKIFSRLHGGYRNSNIPKAKTIVQISTDRSLEDFYKTQQKTFDRQNLSMPFSFEVLKKLDLALEKNNARKIFFAVDEEDQIHSVVYLIWDKNTAYYLMAGDDPDLRNSGAGIWTTWHSIKYAKEILGKKDFDFLGSMIEPITRVRRNFGAEQVPYFEIKKYKSRWVKVLHGVFN